MVQRWARENRRFKELHPYKKHPFFQPLKQIDEFKKFHVHKTLVWDNGADIAPEYLRDRLVKIRSQ